MSHLRRKTELGQWRFAVSGRVRGAILSLCLLMQSIGVIAMHPCQLSYYNLLVGGSRGADWLGFERTYWGDSVTRSFLRQVATSVSEGDTLVVSPVLHQFQLDELLMQSPILRARGIRLVAESDLRQNKKTRIAGELFFCRKAELGRKVELDFDPISVNAPHVGWPCWLAVWKPSQNP